jgi:hypothetical protein
MGRIGRAKPLVSRHPCVVGKYCEEKDEHDTPPKVDELIEDARHELDLGHVDIDKKSQYQ